MTWRCHVAGAHIYVSSFVCPSFMQAVCKHTAVEFVASNASKIDGTGAVSLYHCTTDNHHFMLYISICSSPSPWRWRTRGETQVFTAPLNVLHCSCRNLPRVTVGVSEWERESERLGASQWRQWDVKHVYIIAIMHLMQHSIIWSTLSHAQTILLHA